ncbi:uncharacterized protein [Antedon mediterranea]|uniref:uncharacterized protein n=1 Tax=Antedon mediterranea TaxID=105859 RepID=UPI003AF84E52
MSVMTELTGNLPVPRYKFEAPKDHEAARIMDIISEYLDETQVESKVLGICQSVLEKPQLPYNPYPEMISRLRCFAERFHMFRKDIKSLKSQLENALIPTSIPSIFGVEGCDNAWGLKDIVHVVNPTALKAYDWLLTNHIPHKIDFEDNQYSFNGQVLIALIAPCIFQSTLYKEVPSFTVRLNYVLYGQNASMSTRIMVDQVVRQVNILTSPDSPHVFLRALLSSSLKGSEVTEWTFQQEKFTNAVLETFTNKSVVSLEGIFLVDPYQRKYLQGKIEFNFHFVESTSGGKERLKSYEAIPYKTLFEGIFWKKADAEAYYSLFDYPQMESPTHLPVTKKTGKTKNKQGTDEVPKAKVTGITVHIKDTFRQKQQQSIASLYEVPDVYKVSHHTLLSGLIDRGKSNSDLLLEVCQLHQSTSAQLYNCIQYNDVIQDIINSAPALSHKHGFLLDVIERLFEDYQKKLLPLLDNSFFARSSDIQTSHKLLCQITNKCKQLLTEDKFLPKPFLMALVQMNAHTTVLFYKLVEDALPLCPKFKEFYGHCKEAFPDDVPRPQTRKMQNTGKDLSKKKSKKVLYVADEILTHGNEIKDFIQQDYLIINVEEVIESSNRPKIMAIEGALMQYLIDTKLDEVWNIFLKGLLFNDHLPPNPYPQLVTLFTQAGFRMRFKGDSDEKVLKRILHHKAKIHNQKKFIYTIPTSNVFGHLSAICVLNTETFDKVRAVAQLFKRKEYDERRGQLQVSLNMAITKMAAFYGIMMPYLNMLCLSEFCYIRGPMGSHHESILLYTKMIMEDIQNIRSQKKVVVIGLNVNETQISAQDIVKNPDYLQSKLVTAIENKQPITLQICKVLGWRILSIRKQYCLCYVFVDGTKDRQEAYFPTTPEKLYCNLFLTANEACNHITNVSCGANVSNPMEMSTLKPVLKSVNQQILQDLADNKLLPVYELLLIKSLLKQEFNYLPDIWRMFHSAGPAMEYLNHLNSALQSLVSHVISVTTTRATATDEFGFDSMSLGKMMKAYQEKLESVLSSSFSAKSIWPIIKRKLQLITERSQVSNDLSLCIKEQTVCVLEEVNTLLEPVQALLIKDLHSICSSVHTELKAIQVTESR